MSKSVSHVHKLSVLPALNHASILVLESHQGLFLSPLNGEHEDTAGKNLGEFCLFTSRDDAKVWWPWEFLSRPFELLHQSITGVKYASSL